MRKQLVNTGCFSIDVIGKVLLDLFHSPLTDSMRL